MYTVAVCMSSEMWMSAPTDTQTLTFWKLLLLMEGAQVPFVFTVKSRGKDTQPQCEAVDTVCTAVLQKWEGQDAPSLLTTSLEQELLDGSVYHITCHLL